MHLNTASGQTNIISEALMEELRYDLRSAFRFPQFWDGEGDDGGGDGGGDDGASGTDDGADGKDGKQDPPDEPDGKVKDPDKKKLSDEAAAARVAKKAAEKRAEELEAELQAIKDKDKSELEVTQRDHGKLKEKFEAVTEENKSLRREVATLRAASKFNFVDLKVATRIALEEAGITGDEDDLDAKVEQALSDLSKNKQYAYLIKKDSDNEDDDDGDNPSGLPTNGRSPKKQAADRAALEAKFPALRR
jgi:hypothetical protein